MARLVSLATLRTRVQQRANVENASNSALFTTAELNSSINEGIAELYDLILSEQDQPYYLESATFTTTSAKDTYVIGAGQDVNVADFYKLKGLDVTVGGNIIVTAVPFMFRERNRYKYIGGWTYGQPVAYALYGKTNAVANSGFDSIKLIPSPNGAFTCTLWYYPTPPVLVADGDQFDGINGFEEYAVLSAATKVLTKQEQFEHAGVLDQVRARQEARILASVSSHDAENPIRVQDVRRNYDWGNGPAY